MDAPRRDGWTRRRGKAALPAGHNLFVNSSQCPHNRRVGCSCFTNSINLDYMHGGNYYEH